MGQSKDFPGRSGYRIPLQNGILLVFSLIFYAWGEPVYILLMLFASAVDFGNGLLIGKYGNWMDKHLETYTRLGWLEEKFILS